MKVLVINAGSSSLKYQLIDMGDETVVAKGVCERIGNGGRVSGNVNGNESFEFDVTIQNHIDAFLEVEKVLTTGDHAVLVDVSEVTAVGHRIVQGGARYKESMLITDDVLKGIDELSDLAPLHNPAHLQAIYASQKVFGKEKPQVVVFDNAFHSTMPKKAYMFPIPYEYYEKYKIRRYGFHGTSHRYVSARCAEIMGKDEKGLKIITCHLGNGCSITAVEDGKSVDTSMGLTPLDGFAMGTRSGGIDPSVVTFLQEKEGWTPAEADRILNRESGVLGVSGVSSDDRDLIASSSARDEDGKPTKIARRSILAREIQQYQIRKFIGSYVAAMNGVDAIVFTGGIGENTRDLRKNVCDNLSYLGVEFDNEQNELLRKGREGELSTANSKVRVYVIPTNEELVIARDTVEIVTELI